MNPEVVHPHTHFDHFGGLHGVRSLLSDSDNRGFDTES